jgi:hypothetical protein
VKAEKNRSAASNPGVNSIGRAKLRLVSATVLPLQRVSADTIEACRQLYEMAKNGEVLGLAFVAQLPTRRFFSETAGEMARDLTFARGAVACLHDSLGRQIAEAGTTD